jgi:hypothetical protein
MKDKDEFYHRTFRFVIRFFVVKFAFVFLCTTASSCDTANKRIKPFGLIALTVFGENKGGTEACIPLFFCYTRVALSYHKRRD